MSQEFVERVRRGFDRFAETGEAGGPGLHPDLEVFDHDIPDARNPYRGAAGFNECPSAPLGTALTWRSSV